MTLPDRATFLDLDRLQALVDEVGEREGQRLVEEAGRVYGHEVAAIADALCGGRGDHRPDWRVLSMALEEESKWGPDFQTWPIHVQKLLWAGLRSGTWSCERSAKDDYYVRDFDAAALQAKLANLQLTPPVDRVFCSTGFRVWGGALSRDGRLLVTAGASLHVWDTERGVVCTASVHRHRDRFRDVVFSRDDTHVITAAENGALEEWRLPDLVRVAEWRSEGWMGGFQVFSIAISKDGSELLAGNAPSGTIWDLATHTARKRLRWPRRMEPLVRPQRRRPRLAWEKKCPPLPRWLNPPQTRDVAFVSEHVVLVTGHRCTAIWNRATGAALRLPLVGLACAATSDGRWALVYSSGWKLRCLDPATGQTHAEVETRLNSRALAIAPDNRTCYTGNLDEITAWSLPDLQPLRTWRMNADLGARDIATRLLVSPEGRYLYVVGWDRAVRRVVLDA